MTTKYLEIAEVINSQILDGRAFDGSSGYIAMAAWGVEHKRAMEPAEGQPYHGGLGFSVTGALFQGKVEIWLHFSDTYTVIFHKASHWPTEPMPMQMVYAPELTAQIDEAIEKVKLHPTQAAGQ